MDALAHTGDEGRGTLREAAVRCEQPLTRRFPNGETHLHQLSYSSFGSAGVIGNEGITEVNKIVLVKRTRRTETSQYPEEKPSTEIPLVVASERGPGQCLIFN